MTTRTSQAFQFEIGASIARRDWQAAANAAENCRAAWPADGAGWLFGSIVALLTDEKEAALALVDQRLAVAPDDGPCWLQKAECLLALGRRPAALAAAETAAALAGQDVAALDTVGEFLVHASIHTAALRVYDRAVDASPQDASLLAKRAVVHRYLGNFAEAAADHDAVLRQLPFDPDALKGLSELRRQSEETNAVATMEAALAASPARGKDAATLHFGLAKSYEDLGDHTASWRHLGAGNAIERAAIEYDSTNDRAVIERIIDSFPDIEALRPDTTGERPIFIVGLPRTGTTLLERILGSHSQIHAAGELSALSEAVDVAISRMGTSDPQNWLAFAGLLGKTDEAVIAAEYLDRSQARRGDRPRFVDKQPTNFYYCSLILRAFPGARILHLSRHPLAACYAIYKTRFGGTYGFSYDLAELAAFYIGYRRLMAHWHKVLPGRILDVAYEDIVTSLEPTTRRVLDYLDLPFEAACLDFHLNPASTATASAVQVRQPLYDSSLDQWRHYATELGALRGQLIDAGIQVDEGPGINAAG